MFFYYLYVLRVIFVLGLLSVKYWKLKMVGIMSRENLFKMTHISVDSEVFGVIEGITDGLGKSRVQTQSVRDICEKGLIENIELVL